MRIRSNERLSKDDRHGPIFLRQRFSHRSRRLRAATLALAGLMICAPLGLIVNTAGSGTELYSLIQTHAITAFQLGLLGVLGISAFIYGALELTRPALRARAIRLDASQANVAENVSGRSRTWREPLHAYNGIRHQVITTSEGAIHTLLLEHPHPGRTLHLACEANLDNQAIVEASERFGLPILNHPAAATGFKSRGEPRGWFSGRDRPIGIAENPIGT
jgi:hypothetical protein